MAVFAGIIGGLLLLFAAASLTALFWMLLLGVLHHEISASIPAIGFWLALGLSVLLNLAVKSIFSGSSHTS